MKALRRANPNEERIEDVLDAQIGKVTVARESMV